MENLFFRDWHIFFSKIKFDLNHFTNKEESSKVIFITKIIVGMWTTILSYIIPWLGLTWGVYRIFKETGDTVRPESKKKLSSWLLNRKIDQNSPNWASHFKISFINFFTEKHWSEACFILSCRASLFSSIILFFLLLASNRLYIQQELTKVNGMQNSKVSENDLDILSLESIFRKLNPDKSKNYLDSANYDGMEWGQMKIDILLRLVKRQHNIADIAEAPIDSFASWHWWNKIDSSFFGEEDGSLLTANDSLIINSLQKSRALSNLPRRLHLSSLGEILLMVLLINLVVDFIALYETRILIDLMERHNNILIWGSLFVFDFIITGLIFFVIVFLIYSWLGFIQLNQFIPLIFETYNDTLSLGSSDNVLVIPLLTTYVTSLWLYLYAGSGLFIKLMSSISVTTSFLQKHLDLEDKPFRSLGAIAVIFITILYIGGILIFLFI